MKRSTIESIVLILGLAIIGIALFMMFIKNTTPNDIFITNLIFSLGFLVYILYSMMTSNTLNREIRGLNNHVKSLKEEIGKRDHQIKDKDNSIAQLNQEKTSLKQKINSQESAITDLQKKLEVLENESDSKSTDI